MAAASTGILAGIRVLDFTSMIAGPYCTRLLADLGAEVIKCEPPGGDYVRVPPPVRDGKSSYFGHLNCGKKSICLDLKQPAARDVILQLARISDVVVENFRPGVMARLGLDYLSLKKVRPDIVYCAISGYGQSGPEAERPAFAPIIHAASGYDMANMRHQNRDDAPLRTGLFVADYLGGMAAVAAIQSALLHRERFGNGQMVDVALLDTMLNMMAYEVQEAQFPVAESPMLYASSRTRDGHIIAMPITQANFEAMADATGHPEWKTDPRFATFAARKQNWNALMALFGAWASERTTDECERVISDAGCPCSRYRTVGEAMSSAQSRHRGVMAEIDDGAGRFLVSNIPWRMSASAAGPRPWVATLGEHNRDVICGLIGYEQAALLDLVRRGALFGSG